MPKLFLKIRHGHAVLVDETELELVKVFTTELELARRVFAAFDFAVNSRGNLRLLFIAHTLEPPV